MPTCFQGRGIFGKPQQHRSVVLQLPSRLAELSSSLGLRCFTVELKGPMRKVSGCMRGVWWSISRLSSYVFATTPSHGEARSVEQVCLESSMCAFFSSSMSGAKNAIKTIEHLESIERIKLEVQHRQKTLSQRSKPIASYVTCPYMSDISTCNILELSGHTVSGPCHPTFREAYLDNVHIVHGDSFQRRQWVRWCLDLVHWWIMALRQNRWEHVELAGWSCQVGLDFIELA